MKSTLFIFASLLVTATIALADERPYGPAGCGFGSVIMGKDGNTVLSMTTNESSTQTFAISSGTSNCVDYGVVKKNRRRRAFIESNGHQLANDISKGGGETVASLAVLYGCTDEKAFGRALQNRYETIFPSGSVSSDRIENEIQAVIESDLRRACVG